MSAWRKRLEAASRAAGEIVRSAGRTTGKVVRSRFVRELARTAVKCCVVGGATAAGMAVGGPAGAAVAGTAAAALGGRGATDG